MNMVADIVAAKRMDLMAWEDVFYDIDKPIPITEFRERYFLYIRRILILQYVFAHINLKFSLMYYK